MPKLDGNLVTDDDMNFLCANEPPLEKSLYFLLHNMGNIIPGSIITDVNYCFLSIDLWLKLLFLINAALLSIVEFIYVVGLLLISPALYTVTYYYTFPLILELIYCITAASGDYLFSWTYVSVVKHKWLSPTLWYSLCILVI